MNANGSIPFKVCFPSRGSARIGVAASSYAHLRQIVRHKYKVSGEFCLQQEDGTIVCDEDYFKLLEPKTTLTVIESAPPSARRPPQPPANMAAPPAPTTAVVTGYTLSAGCGWSRPNCPSAVAATTTAGGEDTTVSCCSSVCTVTVP